MYLVSSKKILLINFFIKKERIIFLKKYIQELSLCILLFWYLKISGDFQREFFIFMYGFYVHYTTQYNNLLK